MHRVRNDAQAVFERDEEPVRSHAGLDGGEVLEPKSTLRRARVGALVGDFAGRFHGVEPVGVLARLFRRVHRHVGVLHEGLGIAGIVRENAHAEAGGDLRALAAGELVGLEQLGKELAGDAVHRRHVVHFLDHHEELVAPEPRHEVARAQDGAQPARDVDQQPVADIVAVRVVDLLEAVEVHEHAGQLGAAPAGALDRLFERRREAGAVRQAGQRVAVGERGDALARQRDLGDVAPDAAVAEEGARRGKARLAADREVADAAVRPGAPELEIAERRSRLEHGAQLAPPGLARAGDGIDVGRPVHHLREAVLRVGLPEEVRRHLHQAAEAKLALALRFLRLFALEELADVAADDARGLHQALVGLAHRLAREIEHADDAAFGDDRERKAAVQTAAFPQRLVLHARVVHGVLRPDRLSALQNLARQAFAWAQGDRPRTLGEFPHRRVGHAPGILEAQQAARLFEPEIAAAGPALDFAESADHGTHDFVRLALSGQRMRDLVLQAQHLLAALLCRDVAADAAIALEAAAVEYRLAAQRQPDAVAVAGGALDLEITERLAALELGAVPLPVRFGQVERRLLPALAAKGGARIQTGPV